MRKSEERSMVSSRALLVILAFILVVPSVFAASRSCAQLADPAVVHQSMTLCAENYYPHDYPEGIRIAADNVVFDCGTSVMHGSFKNAGIVIEKRKNVTIKNCQIANYDVGILVKGSSGVTILGSRLLRNMIGLKLIDSSGVVVENSDDVSITKPVQLINSKGNTFHFTNKKLQGDQCRLNQCNTPTGMAVHEQTLAKSRAPERKLSRILRDNLRAWLYGR